MNKKKKIERNEKKKTDVNQTKRDSKKGKTVLSPSVIGAGAKGDHQRRAPPGPRDLQVTQRRRLAPTYHYQPFSRHQPTQSPHFQSLITAQSPPKPPTANQGERPRNGLGRRVVRPFPSVVGVKA